MKRGLFFGAEIRVGKVRGRIVDSRKNALIFRVGIASFHKQPDRVQFQRVEVFKNHVHVSKI